jgi:hypothetical protein
LVGTLVGRQLQCAPGGTQRHVESAGGAERIAQIGEPDTEARVERGPASALSIADRLIREAKASAVLSQNRLHLNPREAPRRD